MGKIDRWALFLFIAITGLVYASTFQNEFLAGDEEVIVLRNTYLRDWSHIPNFFTENYKAGAGELSNYYRPVQMLLSLALVQAFGYLPWPFHVVSLLFHAGAAYFFYRVLREYFHRSFSQELALLGAALWLTHPAHNEEMAVATGVASSTYTFFMLAGIYAFLRSVESASRSAFLYSAAVASLVLALWSKESSVIFPGLVLGVHLVLINLGYVKKQSFARMLKLHAPFWAITLGYVALRLTVLNFDNTLDFYKEPNPLTDSYLSRIFTFGTIVVQQLRIFFVPVGLYPERSWPIFVDLNAPVILGLVTLASLLGGLVYFWKRSPLIALGIGWFLGSYFPMSNIVAQINAIIWDHWLYAPSMGLVILVLWLARKLPVLVSRITLCLAVLALGTTTFARGPIWRNAESVSRFILQNEPDNVKTLVNLAVALSDRGANEESIAYYQKAIQLSDVWPHAHHNLAMQYIRLGRLAEAESELRIAIKMQADFYYSMNVLGELLAHQGRKEEALEWFRKSLAIFPAQDKVRQLVEGGF